MIYTSIPTEDLDNYQKVLNEIKDWDKSNQPELWSKERIDGEMMYKIHRKSSRIIDETGLKIQQIIYDNFDNNIKIFPYYYQIIKFNELKSIKKDHNYLYQTFTFLNGKDVFGTTVLNKEEIFEYSSTDTCYALAILWDTEINEKTPKWFIRPYHRLFI